MPLHTNVGGTWKTVKYAYVNVNGTWKTCMNVWTNVSGTWKKLWTYSYTTGSWGACSKNCGTGTQTRTVTCTRSDGVTFADAYCTAYGLTKPATSQNCNTMACMTTQTFTSNGTFTAPHAGTFKFTLYGGGGGGGAGGGRYGALAYPHGSGESATTWWVWRGGGGGGGGGSGYTSNVSKALSAGQTVTITRGGGGAAKAAGGQTKISGNATGRV